MRKKSILSSALLLCMLTMYGAPALAIVDSTYNTKSAKTQQSVRPIDLAFVFDGPSDKNQASLYCLITEHLSRQN